MAVVKDDVEDATATEYSPARQSAPISREQLIGFLNEDLAREYQAIIAYVVYSQTIKGAAYIAIAKDLQIHAGEELQHALLIAKQIDYLGGTPVVVAKPVKQSEDTQDMLWFDLQNENETVRNYRDRVRQCEALGEFAMAEAIRKILVQEQEHQIDLATALGKSPSDVADIQGQTQAPRGGRDGQAANGLSDQAKTQPAKKG
jgi:bacterioferritin